MMNLFAKGITDNLGTVQSAMTEVGSTVAAGVDYSGQLSTINDSVTALGASAGQPLYATINIGGEQFDSVVVQALSRANYLSGGR